MTTMTDRGANEARQLTDFDRDPPAFIIAGVCLGLLALFALAGYGAWCLVRSLV